MSRKITEEDAAEEEAIMAQDMIRQWAVAVEVSSKKKVKVDHRPLERKAKRKFRHEEALHCIKRDCM